MRYYVKLTGTADRFDTEYATYKLSQAGTVDESTLTVTQEIDGAVYSAAVTPAP